MYTLRLTPLTCLARLACRRLTALTSLTAVCLTTVVGEFCFQFVNCCLQFLYIACVYLIILWSERCDRYFLIGSHCIYSISKFRYMDFLYIRWFAICIFHVPLLSLTISTVTPICMSLAGIFLTRLAGLFLATLTCLTISTISAVIYIGTIGFELCKRRS